MRGYASVTASFIDVQAKGFPRRTVLLDMVPFNTSHDARSYARVVGATLEQYGLGKYDDAGGMTDSKLQFAVSDSASNMVACFSRLNIP